MTNFASNAEVTKKGYYSFIFLTLGVLSSGFQGSDGVYPSSDLVKAG